MLPKTIFGCLLASLLAQLGWLYGHAPANLAVHFGTDGGANGSASPTEFVLVETATAMLFAFLTLLLPRLLPKIPHLVNIPNGEYWLAPDRSGASFRALEQWMNWLGVGILVLFLDLNEVIRRANLLTPPQLGTLPLLAVMAPLACFLVLMIVFLFRRFPPPRE